MGGYIRFAPNDRFLFLFINSFKKQPPCLGGQLETTLTIGEKAARIVLLFCCLQFLQIVLPVTRIDILVRSSIVHEKWVVGNEVNISALIVSRLHTAERALREVQDVVHYVLGVSRAVVIAQVAGPKEVVLDPDAVATAWIQPESVAALILRGLRDELRHRLRVESHDLDVEVQKTIFEGLLVDAVVDSVVEGRHVFCGQIGKSELTEGSSKPLKTGTAGGPRDVSVWLGASLIRQGVDRVELVKDAGRRCFSVVEEEEKRSADRINEIARQAKLESWDDGGLLVRIFSYKVRDGFEERILLVTGVGTSATPDLAIITKRMCLHPHARNDSKLVSTSSESPPEIRILISS